MSNYQAICGCNWVSKVYSNKDRATGSADVHNMVTHHGEPVVVAIKSTDARLNGHIYAPGQGK